MDATESARIFALPLEGLALVEGVSGAAGGVDARGEAGVAARHVGVVRRRVVAEGVGGAAAGGDVGGGGGGKRERHDGLVDGAVRVVGARLVGDTRGQLKGNSISLNLETAVPIGYHKVDNIKSLVIIFLAKIIMIYQIMHVLFFFTTNHVKLS